MRELYRHRVLNDERQGRWMIRRTYLDNGHKLRITIHQDPYEFQCDYYLEVFNPRDLKWNRVHTEANNNWYEYINALSTAKLTLDKWERIDELIAHMLFIGADLLEGVDS